MQLAELPTRLKRLDATTQERLINWGYAVCDAALRKHGRSSSSRSRCFHILNQGSDAKAGAERGKGRQAGWRIAAEQAEIGE